MYLYLRNVCLCMFVMPVCANKCANVTPHLCISIAVDPKGWFGSSPGEWWNVVNVQHLGHQLRPRYHSFITRFSHLSLSALTSLINIINPRSCSSCSSCSCQGPPPSVSRSSWSWQGAHARRDQQREIECSPIFTRKLWRIIGVWPNYTHRRIHRSLT